MANYLYVCSSCFDRGRDQALRRATPPIFSVAVTAGISVAEIMILALCGA